MIGIGIGTHRRRIDGFLPDDLGDLAVWLRADQGITTVGGAVEFWNFVNGTFRGVFRVAQGTAINRPTHVVSDPNYNNQSTISFDGNDLLDTPAFTAPITQPNTIFIVGNVGGVGEVFIDAVNIDASADRNLMDATGGGVWRMLAGTSLPGSAVDTDEHILEAIFNGVSSELILDGTSIASGDTGTEPMKDLRIGASITPATFLTGTIAEIIIYNALLNATDRALVRNYLRMRYGTP